MGDRITRRDFLNIGKEALKNTFWLSLGLSGPELRISESANNISFRKDSVMSINNEPVFPLGLYYLPGSESPESWKKVRDAGLNAITQWWINDETVRQAENNGIYTMAYLPYVFPTMEEGLGINMDVLQILKESKSFIGYYGADEPDITLQRNLHINSLNHLEKLDPGRPGMAVFAERPNAPIFPAFDIRGYKAGYQGNPDDLYDLPDFTTLDDFKIWYVKRSGIEVVSFDYYDSNSDDEAGLVGGITEKYVRNLRSGKFGSRAKAVWVTLSAHSEIPRTLKSMRFQAINAIAHGATGVFWWDWPPKCSAENCPGYPGKGNGYLTHWGKLQSIGSELGKVQEGLVGQEVFMGVNKSQNVAYKVTRSAGGKYYVFTACNSKNAGNSLDETFPVFLPDTSFQVLGEGRTIDTDKNGNLNYKYGPLDARIFVQL